MGALTLFLIALGLSMDAFAVSVSTGCLSEFRQGTDIRTAAAFGLFQLLMPVIGYLRAAPSATPSARWTTGSLWFFWERSRKMIFDGVLPEVSRNLRPKPQLHL
jgi:putative Mn2+ efflux pump MntP